MRIPGFLLGSVRVRIPKVGVYIGLLGSPVAYIGSIIDNPIVTGAGIGMLTVMPLGVAFEWLAQRRLERKTKHWPAQVQMMLGPDGGRIAFVTTQGGSVSSLQVPDDYDPDDDFGEWFLREVAPDLAAMIFDDDEEAPE